MTHFDNYNFKNPPQPHSTKGGSWMVLDYIISCSFLRRESTGVGLYFIALVWECHRCRSAGCTIYNTHLGTNPIEVNLATVGAYFIRAYAIRPYEPSPQCCRFCLGTINKTCVDTFHSLDKDQHNAYSIKNSFYLCLT